MAELKTCPKCAAELPENAPAGICPKCLMQAGLASEQDGGSSPHLKPTTLASRFVPPEPEELAKHFPQLEILELLGKGGMGAVYKARQPGLDRLVAVKILPPEVGADPAFAERFTREARALAKLSHQNIVSVFDSGRAFVVPPSGGVALSAAATSEPPDAPPEGGTTNGLYYFIMEFMDGTNLRQLIETGGLKPEAALAIVPQICEALQFAHNEGIVHRDIKPENILVDKQGRVKIADFGLAKLLGQDASDNSLTATHQVMGTLHYMAPEQMRGAGAVDHRADIYSLGVVFYELLTGELPMGRFEPPSKRVQIDVRFDDVVLRSLESEPDRRYQHASELKSGIKTIVEDSLPGESKDRTPASQRGSWKRHSAGLSAIAERELRGAWRWVVGDAASPTQPPVFPGRLMTLLSLAGCLMLMVPWLELHIGQDANVKQFWSNAELPGSFSRTLYGSERWPGIATGVAFGLLTLLLIMTPGSRPLTWKRAAVMTLIAAYAVAHTFLFKPDVENRTFTIPVIWHEDARMAGRSGASSGTRELVGEPRMERVMGKGSVPLKSIEHQVMYREGFYGSLVLSVVLLVFSSIGVRHAMARGADAPAVNAAPGKRATHMGTGSVSWPPAAMPTARPKLVPVLATFNLVGAIVLMLACAMEEPAEFAKPLPRLWQVWEQVDAVLGFVMAAGMFAASIGLFLWKPWARKLTLVVCVFGLASLVFDAPYLARTALPELYAEIQQAVIAEGVEPDLRDFVTLSTFVLLFGGMLAVGLTWLIGQLIYFNRPQVVAAFGPPGKNRNTFIEWLFTGTGAVVGVLSVFGPLALLLGLAALFNGLGGDQSVSPVPASVPPLGRITSGIGAEFTVPAGQVAVFEIVTRRDNETVPVPPHCGYVMASPDGPVAGSFRWSPMPEEKTVDGRHRNWSLEILTVGGRGYTEGTLLPDELNDMVGSMSLGLGPLEPNEEVVHWGISDVRDLPANGLIGLRVTVVPHGMKTGGSGNAHIDWKKAQSAQSTTRRKLPEGAP